jgi:hypothetical protein
VSSSTKLESFYNYDTGFTAIGSGQANIVHSTVAETRNFKPNTRDNQVTRHQGAQVAEAKLRLQDSVAK